ncbi:hypothetical protein ACI1US_01949 [Leucobacter sp. BZR 635]
MVFQWRKWDGSPHWRHDCVYLGADEWGDWVGQTVGWASVRPGRAFTVTGPSVTLIPALGAGDSAGAGAAAGADAALAGLEGAGLRHADFTLTVNRSHPKGMRVYIDLGWDIRWDEDPLLVTGIDMDLDVVRVEGARGTWVDDRDEWAEHAAEFGYPAEVMERLEGLALELEARVREQSPPFDDATADAWLDRLEALGLEC